MTTRDGMLKAAEIAESYGFRSSELSPESDRRLSQEITTIVADGIAADLRRAAAELPDETVDAQWISERSVPIPKNADQAAAMLLIGERWLKENAPERLLPSLDEKDEAAARERELLALRARDIGWSMQVDEQKERIEALEKALRDMLSQFDADHAQDHYRPEGCSGCAKFRAARAALEGKG